MENILIIIILIFVSFILGFVLSKILQLRKITIDKDGFEQLIKQNREDAIKRSRSVIGGQFSEQLAPYLPGFNYLPTESKFIGKPLDFIVFKGLDNENIEKVIFVEVKSGNSKLSKTERSLKEAILNKNVEWEEYKIPNQLTK